MQQTQSPVAMQSASFPAILFLVYASTLHEGYKSLVQESDDWREKIDW